MIIGDSKQRLLVMGNIPEIYSYGSRAPVSLVVRIPNISRTVVGIRIAAHILTSWYWTIWE